MEEQIIQMVGILLMLCLAFFTGRVADFSHRRKLLKREAALASMPFNSCKNIPSGLASEAFLVSGCVCIATDYFKVFMGALRGIFGGELRNYVTLIERARREATVRMLEEARSLGAASVWNVRLETATIGGKGKAGGIEILVYGTAVK